MVEYQNENFKKRKGLLDVQRWYLDFRKNVLSRVELRNMMEVASVAFAPVTRIPLDPDKVHPLDRLEVLSLSWAQNRSVGIHYPGWRQPFEARMFVVDENNCIATQRLRRACDLGYYPLQDFQQFSRVPVPAGSKLAYGGNTPNDFKVITHPQPLWIDLAAGTLPGKRPAIWFRVPVEFKDHIEIEHERTVSNGDVMATVVKDCHIWVASVYQSGPQKGEFWVRRIAPPSVAVSRYARALQLGLQMGEECVSAALKEIECTPVQHWMPDVLEERDTPDTSYAVDSEIARRDLTEAVGLGGAYRYCLRSAFSGEVVGFRDSPTYSHLKEFVVKSQSTEHAQLVPKSAVLHKSVPTGSIIRRADEFADVVPRLGWTSWQEVENELDASANSTLADFVRQQLIPPGVLGYIGEGVLHPCRYMPANQRGAAIVKKYLRFTKAKDFYVQRHGAIVMPPFFHSHIGLHQISGPGIKLTVREAALRPARAQQDSARDGVKAAA